MATFLNLSLCSVSGSDSFCSSGIGKRWGVRIQGRSVFEAQTRRESKKARTNELGKLDPERKGKCKSCQFRVVDGRETKRGGGNVLHVLVVGGGLLDGASGGLLLGLGLGYSNTSDRLGTGQYSEVRRVGRAGRGRAGEVGAGGGGVRAGCCSTMIRHPPCVSLQAIHSRSSVITISRKHVSRLVVAV